MGGNTAKMKTALSTQVRWLDNCYRIMSADLNTCGKKMIGKRLLEKILQGKSVGSSTIGNYGIKGSCY